MQNNPEHLYVNTILLNQIMGHSTSNMLMSFDNRYTVGQRVKIIGTTVHDNAITGLYCYRYIHNIEHIKGLEGMYEYTRLYLCALYPVSEPQEFGL